MDEKQRLIDIAYSAYLFGFVPIPLRGKIPRARRWQNLRNKQVDQMDIASGKYPSKVRLNQHLMDMIDDEQMHRRHERSQKLKEERIVETKKKQTSSKRMTLEELRLLMGDDEE